MCVNDEQNTDQKETVLLAKFLSHYTKLYKVVICNITSCLLKTNGMNSERINAGNYTAFSYIAGAEFP